MIKIVDSLCFYVPASKDLDNNTDLADAVNRCLWAWSNRWRAWQSQSPSGRLVDRDSSVHEVSLDVSDRLSPILQPEVAVPELRAASSFQS